MLVVLAEDDVADAEAAIDQDQAITTSNSISVKAVRRRGKRRASHMFGVSSLGLGQGRVQVVGAYGPPALAGSGAE